MDNAVPPKTPRRSPPKTPRRSREEWIEAAAAALARDGVQGVRVEVLARDLDVTKGSFYWHFADRQELLDALVETWANRGTDEVIAQVESHGGTPADRLRRLWDVSSAPGHFEFELSLREWGRRDPTVADVIRGVDERRLGYLRRLFGEHGVPPAEVEARCMLMYSLLIGDWFITVRHGRQSRARVLRDALEQLLRCG